MENMPEKTKRCPFCAETILAAAIKCRYCHSQLPPLPEHSQTEAPAPYAEPKEAVDEASLVSVAVSNPSAQGGTVAARSPRAPSIGGVLGLWTIGLVLFPIRLAINWVESYTAIFGSAAGGGSKWFVLWHFQPQKAYLVIASVIVDASLLAAWICVVQAFFRRLESTRRLAFIFLALVIIDSLLTLSLGDPGSTDSHSGPPIIVGAVFWIIYLTTGKRPRQTFVAAGSLRRAWLALLPIAVPIAFGVRAHAATSEVETARSKILAVELRTNDLVTAALLNRPEVAARANDLDAHPRTKDRDNPWGEFASLGLLRLDDETLETWALLLSRALDAADEATCAAKWTGGPKAANLVTYLTGTAIDQWARVSSSAMIAELLEKPPRAQPGSDDGKRVMTEVIAPLDPDETAEFSRVLQGNATDHEMCWATRTVFHRSRGFPPDLRRIADRWLASL